MRRDSKRRKNKTMPSKNSANSLQMIQEKAYCLWEGKGKPQDSSFDDWLEAERQLKAEKLI